MSATEVDTRMKRMEGRLDKAESLLDSAGRALRTAERAHESVDRGSRVPLLLVAASVIIAATGVSIARRLQAT